MGGWDLVQLSSSNFTSEIWGFPKIGDPNIVPLIGRILITRTPNRVPLTFGNSQRSLAFQEFFRALACLAKQVSTAGSFCWMLRLEAATSRCIRFDPEAHATHAA